MPRSIEIPLKVFSLKGLPWKSSITRSIGFPLPLEFAGLDLRFEAFSNQGTELPIQVRQTLASQPGFPEWVLADIRLAPPNSEIGDKPNEMDLKIRVSDRGPGMKPRANQRALSESHLRFGCGIGFLHLKTTPKFGIGWSIDRDTEPLDWWSPAILPENGEHPQRLFQVLHAETEEDGLIREVIRIRGTMQVTDGMDTGATRKIPARITLDILKRDGLVRIETLLWNPHRAMHKDGLWDLGDAGSIGFSTLQWATTMPSAISRKIAITPDGPLRPITNSGVLHQASAGGDLWNHPIHSDHEGKITTPFRGYQGTLTENPESGERAEPIVIHDYSEGKAKAICGFYPEKFWQRFPNKIVLAPETMAWQTLGTEEAPCELQGGERARSAFWIGLGSDSESMQQALATAHAEIHFQAKADFWLGQNTWPLLPSIPLAGSNAETLASLLDSCLDAKKGYAAVREHFQEFGWRNEGEISADHEAEHYPGKRAMVSHYNNQYDQIIGFLNQFLATGKSEWLDLGNGLARHVGDIDIYHTEEDKAAYNGGYFWHTAHYAHAGRSTHRTYSKFAFQNGTLPAGFGGGPSNEHNYVAGLLASHLMTGDSDAHDAVLQLAMWTVGMQDGSRTPFRWLSGNPTGLATCTRDLEFQGPGRGAGNTLNAYLDAHFLTQDEAWLHRAETLIEYCIHPLDDQDAMELLDRERRWSYIVFLQCVGRYLEYRRIRSESSSEAFERARAALNAYALWMCEREFPFLDKPESLEFPTSTWAAQDLRKVSVFLWAARFSPDKFRDRFAEKAHFFLEASLRVLSQAPDRDQARNRALILHNLPHISQGLRALSQGKWNLGLKEARWDFPPRRYPMPQKQHAMENAKAIVKSAGLKLPGILWRAWRCRITWVQAPQRNVPFGKGW